MHETEAEPRKFHAEEVRDSKGKYSTPNKNKKDKIMVKGQASNGRWAKNKHTARENNSTKARGNHTRNTGDTKEVIHLDNTNVAKRSGRYDAETDTDEIEGAIPTPAINIRKDMEILQNKMKLLQKVVKQQGNKITTLETIVDKATV